MNDTAIIVTTCDRPGFLAKSLSSIKPLRVPILIVDDSRKVSSNESNLMHSRWFEVEYLRIPENRGLAGALNIGLSYYLADKRVEWISCFQDDVEVDPDTLAVLRDVQHLKERPLLTGHDAAEHKAVRKMKINDIEVLLKDSCRATHMHAHRDYWRELMPIPTRELGAPKRIPGQERGLGSNVDWYVATHAPTSVKETGRHVACVPGIVRTFSREADESTWGNGLKYDEPPLSRAAIKGWRK